MRGQGGERAHVAILTSDRQAGPALGVLLATSALLLPLSLIGRNLRWPGARTALTWSGMLTMGLFSSLFVLTVLRDVLLLALAALVALWPGALALEWITLATAWAVPAAAATVTVLGAWNARRTAAVVRVNVPVTDLPDALHGFAIVQISDIHIGPTIRGGYLQAIVDRVNGLQADMVAVTGDLVDGSVTELAGHVAPPAAPRSRLGTFFVTGNHQHYSGAPAWITELQRLNVRVLLNEHVVLRHDCAADLSGSIQRPLHNQKLLVHGCHGLTSHPILSPTATVGLCRF